MSHISETLIEHPGVAQGTTPYSCTNCSQDGDGVVSYHLTCCQVKDTEAEVLSSLGISDAPALVVLTSDGQTVPYKGQSLPFLTDLD